jgi:hypothetical protein
MRFMPRPLYPLYSREKSPGASCTGGWVGPIVGLDAVKRPNISGGYYLLECDTVDSSTYLLKFQINLVPPSRHQPKDEVLLLL